MHKDGTKRDQLCSRDNAHQCISEKRRSQSLALMFLGHRETGENRHRQFRRRLAPLCRSGNIVTMDHSRTNGVISDNIEVLIGYHESPRVALCLIVQGHVPKPIIERRLPGIKTRHNVMLGNRDRLPIRHASIDPIDLALEEFDQLVARHAGCGQLFAHYIENLRRNTNESLIQQLFLS